MPSEVTDTDFFSNVVSLHRSPRLCTGTTSTMGCKSVATVMRVVDAAAVTVRKELISLLTDPAATVSLIQSQSWLDVVAALRSFVFDGAFDISSAIARRCGPLWMCLVERRTEKKRVNDGPVHLAMTASHREMDRTELDLMEIACWLVQQIIGRQ
jgi:hypothetical protein